MKVIILLKAIRYISLIFPAIAQGATTQPQTFPKLLGMQVGAKIYDNVAYQQQMAKLDVVILGFPVNWSTSTFNIGTAVQAIKSYNPNILVGQYTILDEAYNNGWNPDIANTLNANNWWLKNVQVQQVQWTTSFNTWDINFTTWTKANANGDRYPQWYAKRMYNDFFGPTSGFDIWYFDNVTQNPLDASADWKQIGTTQFNTDADIQAAHRAGHAAEWATAKQLAPNLIQMGNSSDNDLSMTQWSGKLGATYLEALMGLSWSIENWGGWWQMMYRYYNTFTNLAPPKIVGFNVWNYPTNYYFFRYAYASCLMNNGYFSYTDPTAGYSTVVWFDEYDVKLGAAIDAPPVVYSAQPVKRHFQNGLVIVNPTTSTASIPVEAGYRHFVGKQDPVTNNGAVVNGSISMPPKSGIVLIKN